MNTERILEAVDFATKAHEGQVRKYEHTPYVHHVFRVAKMVARARASENAIIAALLHDVIEDCYPEDRWEKAKEIIGFKFGTMVQGYVWDLTHPPKTFGNRAKRKSAEAAKLIAAPNEVHTIKLADTIDNTESIVNNDPDFGPRFIKEKLALVPYLNKGNAVLFARANKMIQEGAVKFEKQLEKLN